MYVISAACIDSPTLRTTIGPSSHTTHSLRAVLALRSRAGFSSLPLPLFNTHPLWTDVTVLELRRSACPHCNHSADYRSYVRRDCQEENGTEHMSLLQKNNSSMHTSLSHKMAFCVAKLGVHFLSHLDLITSCPVQSFITAKLKSSGKQKKKKWYIAMQVKPVV